MRAIMLGLAAGAVLLAGCVEETDVSLREDVATTAAEHEPAAEAEPVAVSTVAVVFTDSGMNVSPVRARTGAVSLVIRNRSTEPHSVAVRGGQEQWESGDVAAGDSVTMSLGLPVGRYTVECQPHAARRERAVLEVR